MIVANWKMHPQNLAGAKVLVSATKKAVAKLTGVSVVIAPPAVFLRDIAKGPKNAKVAYAAQNMHWDAEGSHTGEISASEVKDAGATYVLIGHAERRALGETNEDTRKKVARAIEAGLKPILCVGESSRDEDGEYLQGFAEQVLTGLADVPKAKLKQVVIGYEPVWAIGAKASMSPNAMHEMSLYIRKVLMEPFGKPALQVPVLYGGSIDEGNARAMLEGGEVQGLLIGRASADPVRIAALLAAIRA